MGPTIPHPLPSHHTLPVNAYIRNMGPRKGGPLTTLLAPPPSILLPGGGLIDSRAFFEVNLQFF